MSWVRVPPEAADFSLKKSLPQVSLNCVVFLCILEGVSKFVYHVYVHCICSYNYCMLLISKRFRYEPFSGLTL